MTLQTDNSQTNWESMSKDNKETSEIQNITSNHSKTVPCVQTSGMKNKMRWFDIEWYGKISFPLWIKDEQKLEVVADVLVTTT